MKNPIILLLILWAQISCAQYTFKYDSSITGVEEIQVENGVSKASAMTNRNGYVSKTYKNIFGDTLAIVPRIAIVAKNTEEIDLLINKFDNKLSFRKKIGDAFVYDCNVRNSDEVLQITTALSKEEDVIGCDAITTGKVILLNTLYPKQYYLHNTSSSCIGTNVEAAWKTATNLGQNITVAVIDEGVDIDHEDLPNVMNGFTIGDPNGIGEPVTSLYNHYPHGVACAGIIGAANNTVGVRGIASNVKIVPVNLFGTGSYINDDDVAEAIVWASEKADILSCSWRWSNSASISINSAIKTAISNRRNGKGCVVVFASGNSATTENGLAFPASVDGVISVGAVDKSGKIWSYSQRGKGLSLVAPSGNGNSTSDIVTTDRMGNLGYDSGNYTERFGGTSAACPQVAGVAALMLSINPDLTAAEVKEILQNTATDLGSTGYDTTYGYGLLNAEAAVKAVAPKINGNNIAKSSLSFTLTDLPENAIATWSVNAEHTEKVLLTTSGKGNNSCKIELPDSHSKSVHTRLTADIKVNDAIVATVSKNITILGELSGTYSVPALTINGMSLPPIVDLPFTAGSTLMARGGCYIRIKSDDLPYYSVSWSGNPVQGWTQSLNEISFSYPKTATSQNTILQFKSSLGGTAQVYVRPTNPPYKVQTVLEGQLLCVAVIEQLEEDCQEFSIEREENGFNKEEIYGLNTTKVSNYVWTIEVLNAATGALQTSVTSSTGEYEFYTSAWPSGIYLIRVTNGIDIMTEKITIK